MRFGCLRGARAGAAVGASLTVADVFVGYASGGRFPLAWWGLLAAYYVPTLAACGGLLGLLRRSRPATSIGLVAALVDALGIAYVILVANHAYLKDWPFLHAARGASLILAGGLAWLQSRAFRWALGGLSVPARDLFSFHMLRPLLLVSACLATSASFRLADAVLQSFAFMTCVIATTTLAGLGIAAFVLPTRVGWKVGRLAAGLAVGVICGRGLATPPPGVLRDQAQPALAGSWLEGKPSVVVLLLDTVGAEHLSSDGRRPSISPSLDAFAATATLHTQCMAPATWTVPSTASLFTGLYPSQHLADYDLAGIPCQPRGLDARLETLTETLSQRGYATAAIVANQPAFAGPFGLDQGFRFLDARLPAGRVDLEFHPLLSRVEGRLPLWALSDVRVRWLGVAWRGAEEIVREAERWLAERRPLGRPYFLFLNFMDAHPPYYPRDAFDSEERAPGLPLYGRPGGRFGVPLDAEESRHLRARHRQAVAYLDEQIGRFLKVLEGRPEWDRTWVIVTADHGESLAEGKIYGHHCATLSQDVLHVPLIIRDPRKPRLGTRDDRPVQLVDIAPTLLQALEIEPPPGLGGGPIGGERRAMMALGSCNCPRYHSDTERGPAEAFVEDGFKYVRVGHERPRLFDLSSDPRETRDLAAKLPDRLERLALALTRAKLGLTAPALLGAGADRSRSEEALRALGYLR